MVEKLTNRVSQAWIQFHRTQRLLLEGVEVALKRQKLPPIAWYDVLVELNRDPEMGLRQFEIGGRILLSKHNLSRLLDRLEKEALVRRRACSEDGRGNMITITAKGQTTLQAMWPVYKSAIEENFAGKLEAKDLKELLRILGKINAVS